MSPQIVLVFFLKKTIELIGKPYDYEPIKWTETYDIQVIKVRNQENLYQLKKASSYLKFRVVFTLVLLILAPVILYVYIYKLPFGLELNKIDLKYYIHDKGGRTILAEGFNVDDSPYYPKIEKIVKYSKNKKGLFVIVQSVDNQIWYILIQPKSVQNYLPELEVIYSIYSESEYNELNLNDFWIKVR